FLPASSSYTFPTSLSLTYFLHVPEMNPTRPHVRRRSERSGHWLSTWNGWALSELVPPRAPFPPLGRRPAPAALNECLLVLQNGSNRARAMACTYNLRAELPGRVKCRHPLAHVPVTQVVVWSIHADI